jgi:uncharacterized membrane protein YgcG
MANSLPPDLQDLSLPDATPTMPDQPSYLYAKTGLLVEPVPQAHLDRNQWMENLAPERLPDVLPFTDPLTGLTWNEDKPAGEFLYHDNNDCVRAPIDPQRVDGLRADPGYRDAFQALAGSSSLTVDQALPSAQACYDPSSGQLIASGPYVGTWDFANPDIPGQSYAHWEMDMAPDHRADNYTPVPPAVPSAAPAMPTMPAMHLESHADLVPSSNLAAGAGGSAHSYSDSGTSSSGSSSSSDSGSSSGSSSISSGGSSSGSGE